MAVDTSGWEDQDLASIYLAYVAHVGGASDTTLQGTIATFEQQVAQDPNCEYSQAVLTTARAELARRQQQ